MLVNTLRYEYVINRLSIEELSRRYKIPQSQIEAYRESQSWDMFASDEVAGDVKVQILSEYSDDVLFRGLELELMVVEMNAEKVEAQMEFAKAHKALHGHLFCVNEDNEIIKDGFGNPIPIRLPNTSHDLLSRTNTYKLLISLRNEIEMRASKNKEDGVLPPLPGKKDFKYLLAPRKKDEQS